MTERRVRAYVGLGANVGNAAATLAWAVSALGEMPGVRLRGVSPLYVTAPWGVTDQPDFHNAVVALEVRAGPDPAAGAIALLGQLKMLERLAGRRRRARWGPRELDLDLLVFGRARLSLDRPPEGLSLDRGKADRLLVVPHPEAARRLFVLAPLADIAAGLTPPGWPETVATTAARRRIEEGEGAVRPIANWDEAISAWRRIGGRQAELGAPRPASGSVTTRGTASGGPSRSIRRSRPARPAWRPPRRPR
jgi:2-amino-4-hydroxy-6-hydroxymethyldihydropteridine diphosphokinase